jgi:hypothetical protein
LHNIKNPGKNLSGFKVLFKIPDSTHIVCVVLIVVVLVAIVEVLFPRVVSIVLRRTPIIVIGKAPSTVS